MIMTDNLPDLTTMTEGELLGLAQKAAQELDARLDEAAANLRKREQIPATYSAEYLDLREAYDTVIGPALKAAAARHQALSAEINARYDHTLG